MSWWYHRGVATISEARTGRLSSQYIPLPSTDTSIQSDWDLNVLEPPVEAPRTRVSHRSTLSFFSIYARVHSLQRVWDGVYVFAVRYRRVRDRLTANPVSTLLTYEPGKDKWVYRCRILLIDAYYALDML